MGELPLNVLDAQIRDWVAARKRDKPPGGRNRSGGMR